MATWYFQKAPWTPFIYQGATYELAHLNEYQFSVIDTDAMERCIALQTTNPRSSTQKAAGIPASSPLIATGTRSTS
jgi:hypothetical protein